MGVPVGSKIQTKEFADGSRQLSWFRPNGGALKYLFGFFFLASLLCFFWLMTPGLISPSELTKTQDVPASFIMMEFFFKMFFFLGAASYIYMLYLIFRPQKAEFFNLGQDKLDYDSGTTSPLSWLVNKRKYMSNPFAFWSRVFKKRLKLESVSRGQIIFVHEKNPSRIYFDKGAQRIIVGEDLSEPEIDWLYAELAAWSSK